MQRKGEQNKSADACNQARYQYETNIVENSSGAELVPGFFATPNAFLFF
jgi:hypothetical protein